MEYKLICTDIDGTLLNKDREVSALTISEVTRIKDEIPFILISSRMPKAMRHLQQDLGITDKPLIAYNGALILDGETILDSTEIKNSVLEKAISLINGTGIHLSLYHYDMWFVPEMDYWAKREENNTKVKPTVQNLEKTLLFFKNQGIGAHKIMCMGDENEIDVFYKAFEKSADEEVILYRSKNTYIEIAHRAISKKTAIEYLLGVNYKEITLKNVVAFGDNYNDVEMLKAVGLGIAVANANEEAKAAANDITETNKNDGVALGIKKYF